MSEGNYFSFENDLNSVYISQKVAKKLFGSEPALGKTLYLNIDRAIEKKNDDGEMVVEKVEEQLGLVVGGIFENISLNNSFQFEVLANLNHWVDRKGIDINDLSGYFRVANFIKVDSETNQSFVSEQLNEYLTEINQDLSSNWKTEAIRLEAFSSVAGNRSQLRERALPQYHIDPEPLIIFGIIAVLIVLVAIFNFTNTSMALAQNRVKEIGVRKVLGGVKKQIIAQFLFENFLTCVLSLLLALYFADRFQAWIEQTDPPFRLVFWGNWSMFSFLVSLLVGVSILAGIYPALYIGRMHPSAILKKSFKLKGANTFTKILLGLQFGISFIAVYSGIVLYQNVSFQQNLDVGYAHENILYLPINQEDAEYFLEETKKIKSIENAVLTPQHLTTWWSKGKKLSYKYLEKEVQTLQVSEDYLELMDVHFIEGTGFDTKSEKGKLETVVINETLAKELLVGSPIGQIVNVDSVDRIVVGVIQDLIFDAMDQASRGTDPMAILPCKESRNILVAKAFPNQTSQAYDEMYSIWKKRFPFKVFQATIQKDLLESAFSLGNIFKELFLFLAILSTVLSASGLFALMSLSINRKVKEIGVRKVLGASVNQIIQLINRPYLIVLTLAWLAGVSLGYIITFKALLPRFKYYIDATPFPFIISLIIVLVIGAITMGGKVVSAAKTNPSTTLKVE